MQIESLATSFRPVSTAALLGVILAAGAFAADAGVQARSAESERGIEGPILGYAATEPGRLEAIFGIPGAAHFGGAVTLDFEAARIDVSPGQDYAIAVDGAGGVRLVTLAGRSGVTEAFSFESRADAVAFSPSGDAAALYDRGARSVAIYTGLPSSPALETHADLAELSGVLTAIAVSGGGRVFAAATDAGDAGAVSVSRGGSFARVASGGVFSALSFIGAGEDLLAADRGRDEILLVRANGAVLSLGNQADGLSSPVAVAALGDTGRALAATGDGRIALLDLGGAKARLLDCPCAPTTVARLAGRDIYRVTSAASGPLYLVDGSADEVRVLFVPARGQSTESGSQRPSSPRVRESR